MVRLRFSPLLLVFWVVSLVGLIFSWRYLPTFTAQAAITVLVLLAITLSIFNFTELLVFTAVGMVIVLINSWTAGYTAMPIWLVGFYFVGIYLITQTAIYLVEDKEDFPSVIDMVVFSALVTQADTILAHWPVSFFNRSLIAMTVFYTLWRVLFFRSQTNRAAYVSHFAFTAVAVILVIGTILWANFPLSAF